MASSLRPIEFSAYYEKLNGPEKDTKKYLCLVWPLPDSRVYQNTNQMNQDGAWWLDTTSCPKDLFVFYNKNKNGLLIKNWRIFFGGRGMKKRKTDPLPSFLSITFSFLSITWIFLIFFLDNFRKPISCHYVLYRNLWLRKLVLLVRNIFGIQSIIFALRVLHVVESEKCFYS